MITQRHRSEQINVKAHWFYKAAIQIAGRVLALFHIIKGSRRQVLGGKYSAATLGLRIRAFFS
jgi:hypothetical protein